MEVELWRDILSHASLNVRKRHGCEIRVTLGAVVSMWQDRGVASGSIRAGRR